MDDKNFINQLKMHQRELHQLMHRRLPILIHFQNNFRLQGFLNNDLTPWQETRQQQSGGKNATSQFPSFYDTPLPNLALTNEENQLPIFPYPYKSWHKNLHFYLFLYPKGTFSFCSFLQ